MRRALGVLFVAAVLSGCSSGGQVDSTGLVCDEFAAFARDGLPAEQRSGVLESMGEVIGNAEQGVQDAYAGLRDGGPGADDVFAQACFDAGWEG